MVITMALAYLWAGLHCCTQHCTRLQKVDRFGVVVLSPIKAIAPPPSLAPLSCRQTSLAMDWLPHGYHHQTIPEGCGISKQVKTKPRPVACAPCSMSE